MYVPIPSRALLRGLAASALVVAGATACSRPDRNSDNSASIEQDTMNIAPAQPGPTAGRDSATGAPSDAPRSATASPSTRRGDTSMTADSAAGYRAMARDTATVPNESDSARVTHDSSETSEAPSDTAPVESSSAPVGAASVGVGVTAAMARDTSAIADQTDTVAISDTAGTLQASADTSPSGHAGAVLAAGAAGAAVAAAADRDDDGGANDDRLGDTSTAADQRETVAVSDSAGIADQTDTVAVSDTAATLQASVDTSHYAEPSDSGRAGAVVAAGAAGAAVAAAAGGDNDAASNGDPVRPAEEANETRGQVTTDDHRAVASADTLDSERIRPPEDSTEILGNVTSYETADEEPVNRTDEVGAAAVGGTLTGAEAVGLTTRQGAQCTVVDPENDEAVRWDMASTPVTLNPCGLGSMNLSKVWTAGQ